MSHTDPRRKGVVVHAVALRWLLFPSCVDVNQLATNATHVDYIQGFNLSQNFVTVFFFLTERSRGVSGKQYFPHSIITEGFLAQANQKGVILSYWFSTRYTGLYFREEVVSLWCKGIHVALEPNPCGKHSSFLRGQARDPLKLALYSWWFRNSWLKMNQSSQSVVVC